ncbi:hypothetical protein HAX54_038461 [Datura stramonium]|uniref:PGG domain-containing protein n=1 Tax=Datura stramonium TaxID=4076 RepID=A0ABS8VML9_DATST|nr:hypothetical protein [Datura stramonium]
MDEAKQKHILAQILAKVLLENYDWSYNTETVPNPLIQASKLKINELAVEILQMYPEVVETLDEKKRNILHIAVEHKNRFLFDYLLKRVAHKERMLADIDENGNTILHYAANVGSPFRTSTADHFEEVCCVLSVFMMMWGILWFKHVKHRVHPRLWDVKNSEGITAEELFERNHLNVRKEAEDAIRNLANSALILATLLCTVNFAAIFTVPGGFDQKTGLPILLQKLKHELWMLIFYLGAALISSVVTIGTLLSFILCKFHSDDFYISLPTRVSNFSTKARCRSAAYKAATSSSGVPQSLQVLCEFWKEEGVSPIDNRGDTILHFLAVNGNVTGLEILDPLSVKDLETRNNSGDTPLHEAVRFGKKDMVERILRIEKDLVFVQNNLGETPLYVAAASGEKEIFDILANCDFSKLTMKRNDGKTVLHATVAHDCYDLAIYIVNLYPELVNDRDNDHMTALNILATKRFSFRSASNYLFAEIGKTPSVPVQMIETVIYSCIPPRYKESKLSDNQTQAGTKVVRVERFSFTKSMLGNSWLQAIDEAKQKHILALILAKMLLEKYDWRYSTDHSVPNPLIQASKLKIDELVVEILKKCPEVVETLDEKGRNILHIAAEHKSRFLFDYLLKKVASKNRMLADIDENGNTVLHYAANVGTPFFTSTTEHIESVWCVMSVLMMMWGVLWFKVSFLDFAYFFTITYYFCFE